MNHVGFRFDSNFVGFFLTSSINATFNAKPDADRHGCLVASGGGKPRTGGLIMARMDLQTMENAALAGAIDAGQAGRVGIVPYSL